MGNPSKLQQVMVITGTSKGIGYGIARHYLAEGFSVAGCSRGKATIEHENRPLSHD